MGTPDNNPGGGLSKAEGRRVVGTALLTAIAAPVLTAILEACTKVNNLERLLNGGFAVGDKVQPKEGSVNLQSRTGNAISDSSITSCKFTGTGKVIDIVTEKHGASGDNTLSLNIQSDTDPHDCSGILPNANLVKVVATSTAQP